ncbi:8093_t:CDS:2 [Diversispora eburnea]|uniref:8093_t:CDS:1 n=1 Tax=Diversispora eburnea TaxID=1213867 RepID=A0A9N9GUV4_9GLOM|nr:8093_t:CDS:2 [Diversispora eburnea]
MNFHEHYSELLKKLPPSIKKNIWNRLISKVHNPLSEEQASSIHSDIESNLDQTEINLRSNLDQTEINLRLNLQETLNSIKQQKEAECNQIRLDMALKSRNLFEYTLKKYIRDGTIYNLIHLLEEADRTRYPDISRIVKKN